MIYYGYTGNLYGKCLFFFHEELTISCDMQRHNKRCFKTLPVQTGDSETEILEEKKNKSYKFTDVRGDLCIDSKVLMQKGHRLNCKLPAIGGTQECWFSKMKDVKREIVTGRKTRTSRKDICFIFPHHRYCSSSPVVLYHIRRGCIASSRIFAAVCFVTLLGKLAVKPRELQ